jgi:hypothetical protein
MLDDLSKVTPYLGFRFPRTIDGSIRFLQFYFDALETIASGDYIEHRHQLLRHPSFEGSLHYCTLAASCGELKCMYLAQQSLIKNIYTRLSPD